jgi:cytochrome d ubiquinol oxidase subunit I
MVGLGVLMVGFVLWALMLKPGGHYHQSPIFLNGLRLMSLAHYFAVLGGWLVTETGLATWLIYGQMTHAQGLTPPLTSDMALA